MQSRKITSRDNPWIRRFRRAAERHEEELLLEGPKQLADALAAGARPIAVAASEPSLFPRLPDEVMLLELSPELLAALSETVTPHGIVALCSRPSHSLESLPPLHKSLMILDAIQDPGNVGTLIRLAAAFGCDAVAATTGSADPFGSKALRAAAGNSFTLPIVRCSTAAVIDFCAQRSIPIIGADGHASDTLAETSFPAPFALAVGSEGTGLSQPLREASRRLRIEIDRRVESLNVAAAAAIILYEASRHQLRGIGSLSLAAPVLPD